MAPINLLAAVLVVAIVAWLINTRIRMPVGARNILNVVLGLIAVGMFLWLVNTYVPMAGSIRAILNIVVVIASCVWVLKAFGLWVAIVRAWGSFTSHRILH
jgi:hypothetical protein